MASFLMLLAGFVVTILCCEVLRSGKLQSSLGRIAIIHAVGLAAVAALLRSSDRMAVVPVLIFWSGAALAWFGARSHLESSILLRMVHFLREGPLTREEVIARYDAHDGRAQRVAELIRGGLVAADPNRVTLTPTPKGLRIVRVVSRLR
jgi:hypothetical protein